jgi:alpha-ketoglutarate-dependent taurine dioxygenase
VKAFDTKYLKAKIGSEVTADARALTGGAFARELRALLIERGVLVFRNLDITLDEQREITASLGRLRGGLQKVTRDEKESPEYAAYFNTTFFWHMDGAYGQKVPGFAASLRPARLPSEGGQTEFLNAYAAYDDLPDDEKRFIDRLRVVHSRLATMSRVTPDATDEEVATWRRTPPATQPLVWAHESGRKSLMLGNSVSHIEGMHPADSDDLLRGLRSHMTQAQYVYSHEWRMNDLLVWNNTGTMHRARPFDARSDRLLNRFSLEGEEPIRAPGE